MTLSESSSRHCLAELTRGRLHDTVPEDAIFANGGQGGWRKRGKKGLTGEKTAIWEEDSREWREQSTEIDTLPGLFTPEIGFIGQGD